jgi:hypothetical protein
LPGVAAISGVIGVVSGLSLGVIKRERWVCVVVPSVLLTHLFYLAALILYLLVNWLGVPAMVTLDVLLAVTQLALVAFATFRAERSRVAPALVGWFGLTYAMSFAIYAYLHTYYVGL